MKCGCVDVEIGSYANTVTVPAPDHMRGRGPDGCYEFRDTVCLDRCIATEVQALWNAGVVTNGSCCGHNKREAYIGVVAESIPLMESMGYVHLAGRKHEFVPKLLHGWPAPGAPAPAEKPPLGPAAPQPVELKPCPFCGSADVALRDTDDDGLVVGCGGCGAASIAVYGEKEPSRIVTPWNRRAPQPDEHEGANGL